MHILHVLALYILNLCILTCIIIANSGFLLLTTCPASDKWGLCCQKQISKAGISNYIPQYNVGYNYLSLLLTTNKVHKCCVTSMAWRSILMTFSQLLPDTLYLWFKVGVQRHATEYVGRFVKIPWPLMGVHMPRIDKKLQICTCFRAYIHPPRSNIRCFICEFQYQLQRR